LYNQQGLTGGIRHHKMPDYNETGYIGSEYNIKILRVEARNINFTQEQLNNIQGYIIGYQPRVDDSTTRIIDNGFAKPYSFRVNSTFPIKYQPSLFTGNTMASFSGFGNSATQNNDLWRPFYQDNYKYAMYYSPDTLLDKSKIKSGYQVQRVGYACNYILAYDNQPASLNPFDANGTFNSAFNGSVIEGSPKDAPEAFLWSKTQNSQPSIYQNYRRYFQPYVISKSATNSKYIFVNLFFEGNAFINHVNNPNFAGTLKQISKSIIVQNVSRDPANVQTASPESDINVYGNSEYIHLTFDNSSAYNNSLFFDAGINILALSQYSYCDEYAIFTNLGNVNNFNRISFRSPYSFFGSYDPIRSNNTNNVNQGLADFSISPKIPLVRIINDFRTQYGVLENATYTPCAVVYNDTLSNSNNITLEGDVYISKVFQKITNTARAFNSSDSDREISVSAVMGYYVESKNNYSLRHQEDLKAPYYPKFKYFNYTSDTGGIFNFDFKLETLSYNKQYSTNSGLKLTFPRPLFFNENTNYGNRSVYSSQSFESELVDQYRMFPPLNFHDVPRHRGVITDTFVFNNNFYHHTEYGLWLSYFNPNTTQATSQGQVVLGNAGVFQLPSKLVLDIKGGYMGTMDKSGTNTPFGRVFLDHKQGKIFILTGESPIEISDLGLFSYFREFVNTNDEYSMGYDWANKRLLINNISKGKALSFYPKTNTWTSFHNFSPQAYFTTNGYSYAFKDNSFYNLNNAADTRKNSYITYVENTSPDTFKRFDKIEMNTMSGGAGTTGSPGFVEPNDYVFLDKSFTHIHAWTDRQNTTELPFSYSHDYNTNFLASYETDKVPVNYYRSSFHAELPLDAVVDPSKNIFDGSNTNINTDFRAHMKGKFLYTKLSYNDSKPLVLNYIKTFFKPTVA